MEERDRAWRERDWRRSEAYGRGGEERSWSEQEEDDRVTEEPAERYGSGYGEGGDDYGGGRTAGAYGRGAGRSQAYRSGPAQVRYGGAPRSFNPDDAGRGYGGEGARGSYGQRRYGGAAGDEDRDYRYEDAYDRDRDRHARRAWEAETRGYGRGAGRLEDDDYDARRYGGGRRYEAAGRDRSEGAGDFLQRAGERISSWFRGGAEDYDEPRRYREDFGREARPLAERSQRGVGPRGYRRSDERISDEVHERLTDDPWLDASNIEVEVRNSEVTLTGHVDNREAKHHAERLVEDISGVGHVQNNLRVDPSLALTGAGRGFGSSALEAEMRRNAQATDPENRGVSGLSGRTSTGAEAERSGPSATETPTDPKGGARRS
jgi:osmotically-inducible protein OsmY